MSGVGGAPASVGTWSIGPTGAPVFTAAGTPAPAPAPAGTASRATFAATLTPVQLAQFMALQDPGTVTPGTDGSAGPPMFGGLPSVPGIHVASGGLGFAAPAVASIPGSSGPLPASMSAATGMSAEEGRYLAALSHLQANHAERTRADQSWSLKRSNARESTESASALCGLLSTYPCYIGGSVVLAELYTTASDHQKAIIDAYIDGLPPQMKLQLGPSGSVAALIAHDDLGDRLDREFKLVANAAALSVQQRRAARGLPPVQHQRFGLRGYSEMYVKWPALMMELADRSNALHDVISDDANFHAAPTTVLRATLIHILRWQRYQSRLMQEMWIRSLSNAREQQDARKMFAAIPVPGNGSSDIDGVLSYTGRTKSAPGQPSEPGSYQVESNP